MRNRWESEWGMIWSEDKLAGTSWSKTITSGHQKYSNTFITNQKHGHLRVNARHRFVIMKLMKMKNLRKNQQPQIKDQMCEWAWNEESVRDWRRWWSCLICCASLSFSNSPHSPWSPSQQRTRETTRNEESPSLSPHFFHPPWFYCSPTGTISLYTLNWSGRGQPPFSDLVTNRAPSGTGKHQYGNREIGARRRMN